VIAACSRTAPPHRVHPHPPSTTTLALRRPALILSVFALAACPRKPTPAATETAPRTDAAPAMSASDAAASAPTAPENFLAAIRGTMLRRAIPMLFPGAPPEQVVTQGIPQLTSGVGANASSIDADSPFAVVAVVNEGASGDEAASPTWLAAWPLKPGAGVTVEAREGRGWRVFSDGVFAPTAADAGANAEQQCWVARRQPVGWSLLCGPREILPRVAAYLRHLGASAPDNAAILDVDVRAGILGRFARRQLAEIDRQAPPRGDTSPEMTLRRQAFEQVRRQASLITALATDIDTVRGALTQDENTMHLRLTATMARASSDATRALVQSSAGRQAPGDLLTSLPANVQAWIVSGFDEAQVTAAVGPRAPDVMVAAQAGPEFARVKMLLEQVTNVTPPGTRVDAFTPDEGHTMLRVIRRADAERFVDDFRVAVQSVPARPIGPGQTLRDMAVSMPTPGITGHVLRLGQNLRVPPGARLTPEQRDELQRSLLLVGEGDKLVVVQGRDPIARYRAWQAQGAARLTATATADAVMSGRINMHAFAPFFYGQSVGGLPPDEPGGMDFSVVVRRQGEGATLTLQADAPIGVATGLRQLYAVIEDQRMRAMQQQMEAMRRAQQQQQQMQQMQRGGPPSGGPAIDPNNLPEPPQIQLRPN
jgi:hypothetical protein